MYAKGLLKTIATLKEDFKINNEMKSVANKVHIKKRSAQSREDTTPVYETTTILQLTDFLQIIAEHEKKFEGQNADDTWLKNILKTLLVDITGEMPEVAIVATTGTASNDIRFNLATLGNMIFLAEDLYINWKENPDDGDFQQILGSALINLGCNEPENLKKEQTFRKVWLNIPKQ